MVGVAASVASILDGAMGVCVSVDTVDESTTIATPTSTFGDYNIV